MTDFAAFDLENIRALAKAHLIQMSDEKVSDEKVSENTLSPTGDFRLNPDHKEALLKADVKSAAVLIGIVERENGLAILLTKRAAKLRDHSGQYAFPGGKIDALDKNASACATRESEEEINLDASEVEVLGHLPDYYSGSGFKITPVVALVKSDATYSANPDEVDFVFEVPLDFVMNNENYAYGKRELSKRNMHYYELPYEAHFIWGITAGIIRLFADVMRGQNYLSGMKI